MIDDEDLRSCFALFLVCGRGVVDPKTVWSMADALVEAKYQKEPDKGIVAVKRVKKEK